MANAEHLSLLQKGVYAWNQWRSDQPDVRPDLSRAELSGAKFDEVNFSRTNLYMANLSDAQLRRADISDGHMTQADLSRSDLSGATLWNTDLRDAFLQGTNLSGTTLWNANLTNAVLSDTDFTKARMLETILGGVDLRKARGLASVGRDGPSSIGIDTIYQSGGEISETFLRGAGVPDNLIAYIPSLTSAAQGIQFYSCFISYSQADEDFCKRLHSRMRDEHLRVWFAPEDIEGGKKIHEQIETQIHLYDKLLLVLSESSMSSAWVATEIYHARQREIKEDRQILFPIALCPYSEIRKWKSFEADSGKDMAREIREYFIPDFSNWKDHDAFETAFARLLKDLAKIEMRVGD
jgi:hypothetical protein